MPETREPINDYIAQLARKLHLPGEERDAVLDEVRGHLEERAAALTATGIPDAEAQENAVEAFGGARRISRQLRAAHPQPWGAVRWVSSLAAGALATWLLWLAATIPATIYYNSLHPMYLLDPQGQLIALHISAYHTLVESSPLGGGAFYAYLTLGWLFILPVLALYLIPPFLWGNRARRWWAPGLAYGLGTWISAPWFILEVILADWGFSAEGRIIALALPLSLAAAFLGWRWRALSASTSARALAA